MRLGVLAAPLWLMLTLPFIAIIFLVTSITAYLSAQNSQNLANDLEIQLLNETGARIQAHLDSFLLVPKQINQYNHQAIIKQYIDIQNRPALNAYFLEQVQVYESVSSIYLGNPNGGLASSGREGADGSYYVIYTDDFVAGTLQKFATDDTGQSTNLLLTVPDIDARTRPWYQGAVETGGPFWSAPYVLSTGQELAIAASLPVYDESGELQAVVSVDIFLSQISDFLGDLQVGKTGQAYIMDHAGLLVATSNHTPILNPDLTRLAATESPNPIIANSAKTIDFRPGYTQSGFQTQNIEGKPYLFWAIQYQPEEMIDWVVVLTVPESDFLGQIQAQNRRNFILMLLAIISASGIGIFIAYYVSRPLTHLSQAAKALAKGYWTQPIPKSSSREIQWLAQSFEEMRSQLSQAFKQLEERVQERTRELEAREEQYRGIVEDQTELVCRFKPDYTLTFVNGAYCRYHDRRPEELIGKSFMPFVPSHEEAMLRQRLAQLSPANPLVIVEHQTRMASGELGWIEWVNRAIFDADGQMIEIQSVGRDTTKNKYYESLLKNALAKETELHELKSRFISTVSHEFRTPISIISTSSEIIQRYADRLTPDRQAMHFQRIQEQIQRMVGLLEDVLNMNQAELGQLKAKPEILDLAGFFQNIISEIESIAPPTMRFHLETEGLCQEIQADPKLMRLILMNLLSNAVKYSSPDGQVWVKLDCQAEQIEFQVRDEGIGIPLDVQPHIFDPFYRAENVQTIQGTGLGLAIVKQSLQQYGGTISFESTPNQGSLFTVTLPTLPQNEASQAYENKDNDRHS